jgi:hypothetical protein
MRYALCAALTVLTAATPALATGGFDCRTTDRSGLRVSGVTGRGIVTPLVSARLVEGRRTLSTSGERPLLAIGQSWIDAREIRLDLVDPQALRFEARLRAKVMPRNQATGTIVRGGRTHPVRCTFE